MSTFNGLALVHTWQGDASGAWGNDANWGNGVPDLSSALLFPQDAKNKTNSNTIGNLETGSIQITGNAYRLSGFACYIAGSLSSTNETTNQVGFNLRLGGSISVTHSRGGLVVSGPLTLRAFSVGEALHSIHSSGYVELRGAVEARERTVSPSGSVVWYPRTARLMIEGPGAVEMSGGTANSHGPTSVEDGILYLNKTASVAIPSSLSILDYGHVVVLRPDQIDDDSTVNLSGQARFTVQAAESIGRLEGSGSVDLDGADLTVGSGNSSFTFAGRITGTGGLVKTGNGTFTLDQTHNYFGRTILRGGTLVVDGNISSSPFYLANGTLGGDGQMGSVSVTNGTLAPGLGGTSTKLRMNTLAMSSASRLLWRQDANGQSGLIVDGTVSLNNAQLEITAHSYFAPSNGQVITLIDNRGSQPVKSYFNNVPTNGPMLITDSASRTYRLRYDGGDGNDVTLTFTNAAMQLFRSQPLHISGGNGNATLDPNECVHLTCMIAGTTTDPITDIRADLRCDAEGVFVMQPHTTFENLTPGLGGVSRLAFQISTTSSLPCFTNVPFRLIVRSASHGAVTIPFTLQTGCAPGTGPCNGCLATVRNTISELQRGSTHHGVLIPSGDGDACGSLNTCPTFIDAPTIVRRYHLYSFTNSFYPPVDNCVTLYLTSLSDERLMATVYRDNFNPDSLCSSNFVVCTPRLAQRSTEQCRFRWSAGVIRVVVTEFDGTGNSAPYELRVAGTFCLPEIAIDRLPDERVRLSWPTAAASFELEALPNLDASPQRLGLPTHVWNGHFVKTNGTAGPSHEFFRLALPLP